jgi:hypothetical protein
MPVMAALSDVAPLVGGITVEALHCKFVVRVVCPVGFVLGLSSARWCAAPGVGVVVGAAAPCFASALLRFEVF